MDAAQIYAGMPVMVHFAYERFSPEYSRVTAVEGNVVTVASPAGSRRSFRADTQGLAGDFGYSAYFNTIPQELNQALLGVDEDAEGLRRFRLGQVPA